MRTSDKIFEAVDRLIATEVLATADFRETRSSDADRQILEARSDLLPLLHEASRLRDIDLLLKIELTYLEKELKLLINTEEGFDFYNEAIWQARAAIAILDYVRDRDKYRWAGFYYTLSQDIFPNMMPKDAAQKFFASQRGRLGIWRMARPDKNQVPLLKARCGNINRAKKLYIKLQRRALAASEVFEPAGLYRPEQRLQLTA